MSTGVGVGVGLGVRVGVGASRGLGQRPISVIKHGLNIVSGRIGPRPTLTQTPVCTHLSRVMIASRRPGQSQTSLIKRGFKHCCGKACATSDVVDFHENLV